MRCMEIHLHSPFVGAAADTTQNWPISSHFTLFSSTVELSESSLQLLQAYADALFFGFQAASIVTNGEVKRELKTEEQREREQRAHRRLDMWNENEIYCATCQRFITKFQIRTNENCARHRGEVGTSAGWHGVQSWVIFGHIELSILFDEDDDFIIIISNVVWGEITSKNKLELCLMKVDKSRAQLTSWRDWEVECVQSETGSYFRSWDRWDRSVANFFSPCTEISWRAAKVINFIRFGQFSLSLLSALSEFT